MNRVGQGISEYATSAKAELKAVGTVVASEFRQVTVVGMERAYYSETGNPGSAAFRS